MSSTGSSRLTGMTTTSARQTTSPRPTRAHVVGEGDDAITYDVHGDLADATPDRPVLFMFAAPMEAAAFGPMAGLFTDRPVVTYDPRGAGRNPTGTSELTPEHHAEDLHRVITALGVGPVDVFGSSGGAVTALALAAAHPGDVRRVVAHEPPIATGLPDEDNVLAAIRDIKDTYAAAGDGPAMAKFIQLVMASGPLPDDYLDRPAPDPANFGMSDVDDGTRTNPLIRNMPALNEYRIDVDALRRLGERVVIAVGVESGEEMAARGGRAVADQLGLPVTDFPSHHAGFTSGEDSGYPGDPEAFAAKLREVLA
jgi:pimeloyl-ACP methyl ester carboxylesterase